MITGFIDIMKKMRMTTDESELADLLKNFVDGRIWSGIDLFLYSPDLGSFYFPGGMNEKTAQFRSILENLPQSAVETALENKNWEYFSLSLKKSLMDLVQLSPLTHGEDFFGFLCLVPSEEMEPSAEMIQMRDLLIFELEGVLKNLNLSQAMEMCTLEKQSMAGELVKGENIKLLGEMVGGLTHDFNNIFTGIIGYSEMIDMVVEDEDLKDSVSEILMAADEAKKLIRFISETKKIDPREQTEELNPGEVLRSAFEKVEILLPVLLPGKKTTAVFGGFKVDLPDMEFPPVLLKQLFMHTLTGILKSGAGNIRAESLKKDDSGIIDILFEPADQCHVIPLISGDPDFPGLILLKILTDTMKIDLNISPGRFRFDLRGKRKDADLFRNKYQGNRVLVYEPDQTVCRMMKKAFCRTGVIMVAMDDADEFLSEGLKDQNLYHRFYADISILPRLGSLPAGKTVLTTPWGSALNLACIDPAVTHEILLKPFPLMDLLRTLE